MYDSSAASFRCTRTRSLDCRSDLYNLRASPSTDPICTGSHQTPCLALGGKQLHLQICYRNLVEPLWVDLILLRCYLIVLVNLLMVTNNGVKRLQFFEVATSVGHHRWDLEVAVAAVRKGRSRTRRDSTTSPVPMRSSEVKTQIQTSHSESQKIETKLHKCFYGNMYMGNSHSHPRWECHDWAAEKTELQYRA